MQDLPGPGDQIAQDLCRRGGYRIVRSPSRVPARVADPAGGSAAGGSVLREVTG
jgi:hypothetical protein